MTERPSQPSTERERTRLAVLGSPIAHSLSPRLHAAAYEALGLNWNYGRVEATGEMLSSFLSGCGPEWRGLSLTMPLKRDIMPFLDSTDRVSGLIGVANTVFFDDGQRRGFNTDVAGITRAFQEAGVPTLDEVIVLGGGATAASSLVAVSELGATRVRLWVRTPARASAIRELGDTLGVAVEVQAFGEIDGDAGTPGAVISTLPNGSGIELPFSARLRESAVLFDVAYDPWPTALASSWAEVGGRVIPGIEMLINQALVQIRIFVSGDAERQLPEESRVLAAMRASVARA